MNVNWNPTSVYNRYFSNGSYHARYPTPNPHSLKLLLKHCHNARKILDFGCGNGRYTIPLLQHTSAEVVAYDIAPAAIAQLETRLATLDLDCTPRAIAIEGNLAKLGSLAPFDVIAVMFGVLSHVPYRKSRLQLLRRLRRLIPPGEGRKLIVSVPNAYRRFWFKQAQYHLLRRVKRSPHPAVEPGDILYQRQRLLPDDSLYYHLYTVHSLQEELHQAGFSVEATAAESLFPETWVARSAGLSQRDRALCAVLPAHWGYGIMIVAQ